MLRLLDAYVLDAIGALDERTQTEFTENAERLARALQVDVDTWQQVVEKKMGMPSDSVDVVRGIWHQYINDALADGGTPDPLDFAHKLVDTRFTDEVSS